MKIINWLKNLFSRPIELVWSEGENEIKSGKEVDPMEDGMFPLCYVGNDQDEGLDYWIVCDSDEMTVRECANFIIGMANDIKILEQMLAEEKARTNMLNFGQVGR